MPRIHHEDPTMAEQDKQQNPQQDRSDASRNRAIDPARESAGLGKPQGQAEPNNPAEIRKRDGIDPARESAGVEPT